MATLLTPPPRPLPPDQADIDRFVFRGAIGAIGAFRCPVGHPRFRDSGPIRDHCVVFPRTSAVIAPAGHRRFVGDRGVVPVYNAGQEYTRHALDPWGDRCDYFAVSAPVLSEVLQARDPRAAAGRGFTVTHTRANASLYLRQRELFRRAAQAPSDPPAALGIEEDLLSLVDEVVRSLPSGPGLRRVRDRHRDLADAARGLLAREFTAPLTLSEIAARLDTSAFHLSRVFRAVTGVTLHQHREHLRLSAALERIDDGEDLTSIALEVGYSSHSHFSAAFRRAFGTTPSRFRTA